MTSPDDYGWLRVRLEEPEPVMFLPPDYGMAEPKSVVVIQADPVVSASAEFLHQARKWGYVHGEDVFRVGTEGRGLGVVTYRVGDHPAGPDYRVLTLEGTDRDR